MPKRLEMKLKKEAMKKGMTGETLNAYVYGTMQKMGMMKAQKMRKMSNDDMEKHQKKKK